MAQKERRFQTVFMSVRQTRIFYKECMSHSSILVARCEISGFPRLYSFLDKLLEDRVRLGSPKADPEARLSLAGYSEVDSRRRPRGMRMVRQEGKKAKDQWVTITAPAAGFPSQGNHSREG